MPLRPMRPIPQFAIASVTDEFLREHEGRAAREQTADGRICTMGFHYAVGTRTKPAVSYNPVRLRGRQDNL